MPRSTARSDVQNQTGFGARLSTAGPAPCRRLAWAGGLMAVWFGGLIGTRADEPAVINYDEHIRPILREHCFVCHNQSERRGGLALDSYADTLEGGSGGEVVIEGDVENSRLWALVAHAEQPFMPPDQDRLSQELIDRLATWIEQGMPEGSGSKIKRRKTALPTVGATSGERPPPEAIPMPSADLLRQPTIATDRAAAITALAASPWAPLVAVAGQRQVSLYHADSGELLGILPFPEGEPQVLQFSVDGQLLMVAGGRHGHSGLAALYDITSGQRLLSVGDELDTVLAASLSDDNRLIAIGGPQRRVRVYRTEDGELVHEQTKHTDWIVGLRYSPDGVLLASSDRSGGLVLWEAESGRVYLELSANRSPVTSLSWTPDSSLLVTGSDDGAVRLWELYEGNAVRSFNAHAGGVLAVAVANDGSVASTGRDARARLWDLAGQQRLESPPLGDVGTAVAVTVDGQHLIAGDWLGSVTRWVVGDDPRPLELPANPPLLQQQISRWEQTVQERNSALETIDRQLAQHRTDLDTLSAQVASLQAEQMQQTEQFAADQNEEQRLTGLLTELDQRLVELEQALAEARQQRQQAAERRQAVAGQLELSRQQQQQRQGEIDRQVASEEQAKQVVNTLLAQRDELAAAQQQAQERLQWATEQLLRFRTTAQQLEQAEQQQRQAVQQRQTEVSALLSQTAQLQQAVEADEQAAAELQRQLEQLSGELNRLRQAQAEKERALQAERAAIEEAEQALERVQIDAEAAQQLWQWFEAAYGQLLR